MVKVREDKTEDLPAIIALIERNNESLSEDLAALFRVENPNEEYKLFVAEQDDKIVVS